MTDDAPPPALVHLSLDALSTSSVRLCLEYPSTDGTVTAVGKLIEGLNRAIDNVNVLEDESSAADAAARQAKAARQAELAVLVAEVAPRRAAALAALADALAAGAKAAQQLTDLEAAYSCIAGETMRLERELAATGLWEKRAEVQARLSRSEECRKDSKKAVDAARKAGAAAASRGEKARKQLLRLGGVDGAGAPPIEDELNVLEAARALREAHALTAANEAEAADDVRARKEAATAQVAAMTARADERGLPRRRAGGGGRRRARRPSSSTPKSVRWGTATRS